jgi:hypothetical protein
MRAQFVRKGQRARVSLALLFGRALLSAALCSPTSAHTQTVVTVSDAAELVSAVNTVISNPSTSYQIDLTQNITLTASTTLPAIKSTSNVTIDGGTTLAGLSSPNPPTGFTESLGYGGNSASSNLRATLGAPSAGSLAGGGLNFFDAGGCNV